MASTALLPSTFAMYTMTAAAAAVLARSPLLAEACAAIGIVWAWPVTAIGFLPFAIHVLLSSKLVAAVGSAFGLLVFTLVPVILADRVFYGQWTVCPLFFHPLVINSLLLLWSISRIWADSPFNMIYLGKEGCYLAPPDTRKFSRLSSKMTRKPFRAILLDARWPGDSACTCCLVTTACRLCTRMTHRCNDSAQRCL